MPRRWQEGREQSGGIPSHCLLLLRAPGARDGHRMLCRTGSARHSSAVTASNAPVPKEEAREDADTENISFHIYEYKMSLRKDGKDWRRLELVQKHCKIGKFHRIHYWPVLGRGRYHMTSYLLAARCQKRGGQLAVAALTVTVTMARGCHCPSTTKYRVSTTKSAL